MSGSIRPQGRKNNKYHEPGRRQVGPLVRKASAVMGWGGNEKAESGGESERPGASGRREMSQMKVTRSHTEDALKGRPINRTWSQEKNG